MEWFDAARRGDRAYLEAHAAKYLGTISNRGKTALMCAAENGHSECVKLLLSEIGKQDVSGRTALMYAANTDHPECVQLLRAELGNQDVCG